MEFRVILHLHQFFADYRSSSRLFITNKIRTIWDLQRHISSIFEIRSDFYLVCNSLYLPRAEDVRILKEDDIVVAIPCSLVASVNNVVTPQSQLFLRPNVEVSNISIAEPTGENKPKRKRKFGPEVVDILSSSVDFYKKKSSKKTKAKRINIIDDSVVKNVSDSTRTSKKEKIGKRENLPMEYDDINTGAAFVVQNQLPKDKNASKPLNTSPKVENEESSLGSFKFSSIKPSFTTEFRRSCRKNIELMPISSSPRIVKSVRVYDTFTKSSESDTVLHSNQNIKSESKILFNGVGTDNARLNGFIVAEKAKLTSDVKIKEEIIASPEEVKVLQDKITPLETEANKTDCLGLSTVSEMVTDSIEALDKRKRKRKRVRKKKAAQRDPDPAVFTDLVELKPLCTNAAPSVHIRFEEVDRNDVEKKTLDEVVTVEQNDVELDQNDVEADRNNVVVDCELQLSPVADVDYEKLCNEEILQQPLMKDMLPKKGDVVAFKRYRLSKSYTPEISNFIIARVLHFHPAENIVAVEILVGGDQCQEPDGKFFMESCDNEEQEKNEESIFTFLWCDLLEPRLMFP